MANVYGMKDRIGKGHMKKLVDVYTATTGGFGADLLPPGYGYNKRYRYKINLRTYGLGFEIMSWCMKNCKSKWGWYFIDQTNPDEPYEKQFVILTFKMKQDAVYYMLTHGSNNN